MSNQINRRDAIRSLGAGALVAGSAILNPLSTTAGNTITGKGLPPLKITKVKAIATCPEGIELIVVKVETSEPGLYGIGCATFRQRAHAVVTAIDKSLNDFCVGRDVDNIEDIWQSTYQSSYWRNGPVLNNALSGLDQALWDIKGKRANMPVYQFWAENAALQ
jgi:mannonate dehydratase